MISLFSSRSAVAADVSELEYQKLKTGIHNELVESLDLAAVGQVDDEWMRNEVKQLTQQIIKQRRLKLDDAVKTRLIADLESEVFGLGPIEDLMNDPTVSDILVNGHREVYVER